MTYIKDGEVDVAKIVKHVVIGLVVLILLFSSFGTVSSSEIGVKTRVNKVVGTVGSGLYFKLPFVEQVHIIDLKVKTVDYDKNGAEGDAPDVSALSASSKDLQEVWANVVVNYKVNPEKAIDIFVQYKSAEQFGYNVIEPIIRQSVKAITAQYTAEELVTKRLEISDKVNALLTEEIPKNGATLVLVNLTNFDYNASFKGAIEKKVTAVQLAEAAKNDLEKIKFEQAGVIEVAKATAEAQRISSAALASQGGADYVQLKAIEKWNGILPTQMIPGATVPFINLKN